MNILREDNERSRARRCDLANTAPAMYIAIIHFSNTVRLASSTTSSDEQDEVSDLPRNAANLPRGQCRDCWQGEGEFEPRILQDAVLGSSVNSARAEAWKIVRTALDNEFSIFLISFSHVNEIFDEVLILIIDTEAFYVSWVVCKVFFFIIYVCFVLCIM